jgi:hypothetical protein
VPTRSSFRSFEHLFCSQITIDSHCTYGTQTLETMRSGRLAVKVHAASGFEPVSEGDSCYCAVQLDDCGRRETAVAVGRPEWEETLTFEVPPMGDRQAPSLKFLMYAQRQGGGGPDELLGMGSLGMEDVFGSPQPTPSGKEHDEVESEASGSPRKIRRRVPLVDGVGKHWRDVECSLRFFPTRSAAVQKQRG